MIYQKAAVIHLLQLLRTEDFHYGETILHNRFAY